MPFYHQCRDGSHLLPHRLNKLLGDVVISQGGVVPFINPELLPSKSKCVILSNVSFFFFSSNTTIGLVRRKVQAKKSKALDLDTFVLLFCVVPTITLLVYYYVCISFWHAHRSSQSSLSIHRPAQPVSTCDIVPKPGLPGRNVSQIMVTLWEDVRVSILGKWPMSFNGRGLPALTTCIYICSMPKAGAFRAERRTTERRWASRKRVWSRSHR